MNNEEEIIYTIVALAVLVLLRVIIQSVVVRRILNKSFDPTRKKIVLKILNMALIIIAAIALTSIWGLRHDEILLFLSTTLTILGVAFFAQWSHLSNITSGVIIFFDSSIKIGDTITVMEKDFNITGTIEDIQALTLRLKTDNGLISIPNNVILQKPIKIHEEIKHVEKTDEDDF